MPRGDNHPPREDIPPAIWKPIAARHAGENNITVHQLLYEGRAKQFALPRIMFWSELHEAGHGFSAIGRITGHHHTSIMSGMYSPAVGKPFRRLGETRRRQWATFSVALAEARRAESSAESPIAF